MWSKVACAQLKFKQPLTTFIWTVKIENVMLIGTIFALQNQPLDHFKVFLWGSCSTSAALILHGTQIEKIVQFRTPNNLFKDAALQLYFPALQNVQASERQWLY